MFFKEESKSESSSETEQHIHAEVESPEMYKGHQAIGKDDRKPAPKCRKIDPFTKRIGELDKMAAALE